MLNNIHPTAIVDPKATIAEGVVIGPYCVVGSKVILKEKVVLHSHIVVEGDTLIDEETFVFPFTTIGLDPQDLKYNNEDSKVIIGKRNKIREHVTIHKGTNDGNKLTQIGDNNLLMVGSHVAHDCSIGNKNVIANNVLLAGHVIIGNHVIIGGGSAVHQFCKIGDFSFVGGMSGIVLDLLPFALFSGVREEGEINGINIVGLKRNGFSKEEIYAVKKAYDILFNKDDILDNNIEKLKQTMNTKLKLIQLLINFISTRNKRSLYVNYRNKHTS